MDIFSKENSFEKQRFSKAPESGLTLKDLKYLEPKHLKINPMQIDWEKNLQQSIKVKNQIKRSTTDFLEDFDDINPFEKLKNFDKNKHKKTQIAQKIKPHKPFWLKKFQNSTTFNYPRKKNHSIKNKAINDYRENLQQVKHLLEKKELINRAQPNKLSRTETNLTIENRISKSFKIFNPPDKILSLRLEYFENWLKHHTNIKKIYLINQQGQLLHGYENANFLTTMAKIGKLWLNFAKHINSEPKNSYLRLYENDLQQRILVCTKINKKDYYLGFTIKNQDFEQLPKELDKYLKITIEQTLSSQS